VPGAPERRVSTAWLPLLFAAAPGSALIADWRRPAGTGDAVVSAGVVRGSVDATERVRPTLALRGAWPLSRSRPREWPWLGVALGGEALGGRAGRLLGRADAGVLAVLRGAPSARIYAFAGAYTGTLAPRDGTDRGRRAKLGVEWSWRSRASVSVEVVAERGRAGDAAVVAGSVDVPLF
jgi:hypothetical protein